MGENICTARKNIQEKIRENFVRNDEKGKKKKKKLEGLSRSYPDIDN